MDQVVNVLCVCKLAICLLICSVLMYVKCLDCMFVCVLYHFSIQFYFCSFRFEGAQIWNSLPNDIRKVDNYRVWETDPDLEWP